MTLSSYFRHSAQSMCEELKDSWDAVRDVKLNIGLFFAVFCVLFVIVGNVILLIGINFWLTVFPTDTLEHNSSQIAIQVVASMFLVLFFAVVMVAFAVVYGVLPLWHVLVDTNRRGGPWYRAFLLFASGASNGVCGLLGVYAMTYTPEFVQAVLLCAIPFSAQAWTVLFIPEERSRNYLSLFFIASFVFFVAGVLLSSLSAFLHIDENGRRAPWSWALIYLASSVLFGLWCVVQRLYLDAVMVKEAAPAHHAQKEAPVPKAVSAMPGGSTHAHETSGRRVHCTEGIAASRAGSDGQPSVSGEARASVSGNEPTSQPYPREEREAESGADAHDSTNAHPMPSLTAGDSRNASLAKSRSVAAAAPADVTTGQGVEDGSENEESENDESTLPELIMEKRTWAKQSVQDNAAKLILLVGGLLFQLLISFVCFPIDAIPWFGTSDTALETWYGFSNSVNFVFASWHNVKYGMLYSLGYAMSFIGCTYLNEHSPTLASVVLQLAGPITSLVIIIIPQWDVYGSSGNVGQKVGGVVLLLVAALLYHIWEQRSLKEMLAKAHEKQRRQEIEAAAWHANREAVEEGALPAEQERSHHDSVYSERLGGAQEKKGFHHTDATVVEMKANP